MSTKKEAEKTKDWRRRTLLVIDEDPMIHWLLRKELAAHGYSIISGRSGEDAVFALRGMTIDVLLADLSVETEDGQPLLRWALKHTPQVAAIAMATAGFVDTVQENLRRQGVPHLAKPLDLGLLVQILKNYEDDQHFYGNVFGIELLDYIQLLMMTGRRLRLEITSRSGETAALFFERGEVKHAVCGELEGEEAFVRCITFRSGRFTTLPCRLIEKVTIDKPGHMLLLDSARIKDERARDGLLDEVSFAL